MTLTKIAAAATVLAGLSGMASAATTFEAFSAPGFTNETTSMAGEFLMPMAPAGSTITSYSVLSTAAGFGTSATITFASPTTSYSFLWGSPDSYNSVSDGTTMVSGSSIGSGTGNNADSTLYTFSDLAGFTSLTFSTTGVAFELAQVSPVPEPATFGLMLAGLVAVGASTVRRKRG